ncbi:MAG: MBL fold metallo-hydrolase [Candidatus Latescibacterota bacterium]|nr:MBL fold metallo-hydrolase [Candidatus Latescibacterota bacterium]
MDRLSDHLFRCEDTCSVYGIEVQGKTLLIDCGTDLRPAAVSGVERVLLTHFHRDQCAGLAQWSNAQVYIPAAERHFLEESDVQRAGYYLYDNYTAYFPGFGPLADVRNAQLAHDYETIQWQGIQFEVVPLPGHTFGQAGYVFEIDGQRCLACGDLMAAPGKLGDYYWLQWKYMDFQGHVNQLESLAQVAALDVDLILPGHGVPFAKADARLDELIDNLAKIYAMFHGRPYAPFQVEFSALSPHVWEVVNSTANTYVVKDDEGHAVLIDCGYVSGAPIAANPHRYIDHLSARMRVELGIETVEYFLPTHFHDDHLAGYPMLRARYDTEVVAAPELKELLEDPARYDMPCMVPEGFQVQHVVERGAAFHWRGINFYIEQFPGQTWYDHHITFFVDGSVFTAIGDAISGLCFREERDYIHSFIPKNRTPLSTYSSIPRKVAQRQPDWILTGHGGGEAYDGDKMDRWTAWMDRWQELFTDIVEAPHPNMALDPHWIEFRPYKVRVEPAAEVEFQLCITNHDDSERRCALHLRSVEDVEIEAAERALVLAGSQVHEITVRVRMPQTFSTHSLPIVADVTWDGQRLGQVAEAIAYW